MNTSKLFLLFNYLNQIDRISFINRKLLKQFSKDDALELKLWSHIKKSSQLKRNKDLRLDKAYILDNFFSDDLKSLNRTASRLFKRIKSILVYEFIQDNPIIEDWLFRETIKKEPNRLVQLISDNFIADKYKTNTSFEKDLNSYIQFHVAYEKYLEQSLKNSTDISLFIKARQSLEDYYVKYHSILETERFQRSKVKKDENIAALKSPELDKNQSLLESELLLQKVNALDQNPQYFDFCFNWFTHVVEEELISKEMQKTIFPILYNFSIRNYAKNGKSLQQINIDKIVYLALDKKVLYTEGKLSAFIYVALLSAISVYPEKTETYVKKYLKEVDNKEHNKASYISKLYIAFYNNKFEEVLSIINKNEDDVSLGFDTSLKSKIKFFLLRSYFELGDEEKFLKEYWGSKKYYKSQNLSQRKEDQLINALEFLKQLYFINNQKALLKLEQTVINQNIAMKNWLVKKIKESSFYPKDELPKTK